MAVRAPEKPRPDRNPDRDPERNPDISRPPSTRPSVDKPTNPITPAEEAEFDQLATSATNSDDVYESGDEEESQSSRETSASPQTSSFYSSGNKGKIRNRRQTIINASIIGGIASAMLGAMALFFFFALIYKPQHIREYLLDVHFARFNRAITRRTGQMLMTEAVLSAESTGRLPAIRSGGVIERLRGFNPENALERLGREKGVTLNFEGGRKWNLRRTNEFKGITIRGRESIPLRAGATLEEQADFMARVALVVDESFSLENKFFRGRLIAEIRDLAGIKLSKWPGKGKEFDRLVDEKQAKIKAQQQTIDDVASRETISSASPEVDDATNKVQEYLDDGTAATEAVDNPNEAMSTRIANLTKARPFFQVMRTISILDQIVVFFCLAYEAYVQNIDKIIEQKSNAYKRMAANTFSMADQQKAGDTTSRAVQASISQYDDFEKSAEYRRGQGKTFAPENDLPVDQQPQKALGESPAVIKELLDNSTPAGALLAEGCPAALSAFGQATIAALEAAITIITFGVAEGGFQAGFQTFKAGIVKMFTTRSGIFQTTTRLGAQVGITIFLTDAFVPHLAETYSGAQVTGANNGIQNFNQNGVGADLLHAQTEQRLTGSPLDATQVAKLNQDLNEYKEEKDKQRSFYARILDPQNTRSVTSQFLVNIPTGGNGIKSKTSSFLASINPFRFVSQKVAQAREKAQPIWAADGEDPYGIQQFGIPLELLTRCDTDRSYCPRENALIVEPAIESGSLEKYDKCFTDDMTDMVTKTSDYGDCYEGIGTDPMGQRYILYKLDEEILENFEFLGNEENDSGIDSGGGGSGSGVNGVTCPSNLGQPDPNRYDYYDLPLPAEGDAYSDYGPTTRNTGSQELVCAIYTVGKAYKASVHGQRGSQVQVGDLNAAGHESHKWGVAVDIWAAGGGVCAGAWENNPANPDHPCTGYGPEDNQATIDFGKMWVDTGLVKNIWWCPEDAPNEDDQDGLSQVEIRRYAEGKGTPITIKCLDGHRDHFHVDIKDEYRGPVYEPN